MIQVNLLGKRGRLLAALANVVLLGTGAAARADLTLPHSATANSGSPLLSLRNTGSGTGSFGFWGRGTYGFVGESTFLGGAGARGSFFDAGTGAPRASGNLGRSDASGNFYGLWGRLFSGAAGAAVYGLSESITGKAAFFAMNNPASGSNALEVRCDGAGASQAVYGLQSGMGGCAWFEIDNTSNSEEALEVRTNGDGGTLVARHYGSAGNAGGFYILNADNLSSAMYAFTSGTGLACYCAGQSLVGGDLEVTGGLTPSAAAIKIDHPLDPANRYLQLPAVHSSEMRNMFNGVTVLNQNGEAWVALPEWFEAANGDFTYHLTPIGAPAPGLYVAQEIENNTFQIAGGSAGLKVSWLVTAVRQDPYAVQHPIAVEADKPADQVGLYRHPEAYGLPEQYRLDYEEHEQFRADAGGAGPTTETPECDAPQQD